MIEVKPNGYQGSSEEAVTGLTRVLNLNFVAQHRGITLCNVPKAANIMLTEVMHFIFNSPEGKLD
jgi:hypothetical protein